MTPEALAANRQDTIAEQDRETGLGPEADAEIATRGLVLVIGADGANARHMYPATLRAGAHYAGFHTPDWLPSKESHRDHLVNTTEGQAEVDRLIEERDKWAVYVSLTPELHISVALEYLEKINKPGQYIVLPKPAVRDTKEMGILDKALQAAHDRLLAADPTYSQEGNPILFVHEHYPKKGSWKAMCEKLPEITEKLGCLESVTISIQEKQSVETEGRTTAFAGGAIEDLKPHLDTLALELQDGINAGGLYDISDRSEMSLRRFRYTDTKLKDKKVETSFIINGTTKITDNRKKETHDLNFKLQGGKGLIKEKKATLNFVHPETGETTTIVVDFATNEISEFPDTVKHLFSQTKFEDNGYGDVIRAGLTIDGNPRESFQSWEQARTVTKMIEHLRRQITQPPESYVRPLTEEDEDEKGISLDQIERLAA